MLSTHSLTSGLMSIIIWRFLCIIENALPWVEGGSRLLWPGGGGGGGGVGCSRGLGQVAQVWNAWELLRHVGACTYSTKKLNYSEHVEP